MISLFLAAMLGVAPQATEQMKVMASTEAGAAQEFGTSCLAKGFERASVAEAATASLRKYNAAKPSWDGKIATWLSPYGTLQFVSPSTGNVAHCIMTAFTAKKVDHAALERAVTAMLARKLGSAPNVLEDGGARSWYWTDRAGYAVRLIPVYDRKTPQQIMLMLETVQGSR